MAAITRTNPTAIALGTINRTRELSIYKAVLATVSGDDCVIGSNAVGQKVGAAIGTFSGMFQIKTDGAEVYMVVDKHATDRAAAAMAIAKVLETSTTTQPSFTSDNGTTAVVTLVDTGTVSVTEPTDIEAI